LNDHLQGLEWVRADNIDSSIMRLLPAFNYEKCLNALAAPAPCWPVNTFWRYLNTGPWPPSDKSWGQPISTGSCKKHTQDQGKLELWIPGMKYQRLSDGSESCNGSWVSWWTGGLILFYLNDLSEFFISLFLLTFTNGTQTVIISCERLW
jgi:hypothetical protein